MQTTHTPQPSPTAIRRNHRRACQRTRLLIAYLLVLAVVITGLTVAVYGRNWHNERTRTAVPQTWSASETAPASSTDSKVTEDDTTGEGNESLPSPGEEKHDSIGDDVIVRIER